MVNLQIFLLGLLIVSTLTGLVTEAAKKVLSERNITYYTNTLVGLISLVVSVAIGISYVLLNNIDFTVATVIYLLALVSMSWLCSMVGYDKVIQAISQFKTYRKDE